MAKVKKTHLNKIEAALEKKRQEKSEPSTQYALILELVPTIEQYQKDGLKIAEIHDAISEAVPEINLKLTTFRNMLQKAKKETYGVENLPRGRSAQGVGNAPDKGGENDG